MKTAQPLIYAALITIGIYIGSINNHSEISNNKKINNILQIINHHYVDSVNHNILENDAINSILKTLDPHSSYISIKDVKIVEEDMQGSFSGIGIEFNIIEDSIVVVSPITGGPSEKLGIQSGDRIVSVEKEDVASIGIKNEDVIKRLRGERGSSVNITIKRRGQDDLITFTIIRDDIPLYSIDTGIMLTNDIAYIKINRFASTTYDEMISKTNTLKKKGMRKLILDFRGNPGGYLHIANQICDEFLKEGELIVFTEGRKRKKQEIFATQNGSLEDIKVIALIDEGSASASEIVSGALQDNDRGLLIGRKSFGKGLVQEQITLHDGSVIRLTTQRYYTPSGRCIQKKYGNNTKDYYLEQYTRSDTSIHYPDSLRYTTKKGRYVYGGGGISPDIVIAKDTNVNYLQINTIMSKGWINEFCFEESELLKHQNINNYKEIDITNIYTKFTQFLKKKDRKFLLKLGNTEFKYLRNLLLENISRNLWDNDIYYKVLSQEDEYIKSAINNF
ncbi:MAG: S41 family peptidase [Bacteroidota bacterium]|nr:S41 family peptidase [Bacteroidota bacterium]